MRTWHRWLFSVGVLVLLWLVSMPAQTPKPDVVIQAGRLIDGVAGTARDRATVFITGDRITAVQDGWQTPAGARVIDLKNATVLPGLIDSHTHITSEGTGNAIVRAATETPLDDAVRSTLYAKRTLEAGFTTIRNVGADGGADVALKRAINLGLVPGPRMWTARTILSITGGHGDSNGLRPDLWAAPTWMDGIVDNPDDGRKAVRYQHKYGADLIKITATGGVLSIGDSGTAQQFTDAEMHAIVEAAHLLGLKVAAHAHGKQGIEAAVRAGVDSIEHGTYADDETFKLLKEHNTYLVPTILAGKTVAEMATIPNHFEPSVQAKAAAIGPLIQGMFKRAYAAGVKIAFGTDSGVSNHGDNAREFGYMVDAGMPQMEAILAATKAAADLIGASDRIGSIQAGRYADIIAVAGNPLTDISELRRVTFVMKGGTVYKVSSVPLAPGVSYVDLNFLGQPGIIATVLLYGSEGVALIDPGPSTTLPRLRATLAERGASPDDVRAILLTHIHLDHAGASGSLAALCPNATIYVHERGAPHMIDPSKLVASASRLYGADMERLWGEIRPVPADRLHVLEVGGPGDSRTLRLSIVGHDVDIAWTPGHAWHHVSYFLPAARIACVGDTGGICRPSGRVVLPATPPPDIDLDAWKTSTERILAWEPDMLFLTHFGPQMSPRIHMQDLWTRMERWSRRVRALLEQPGTDDEHARAFMNEVTDELTRATSRQEAQAYADAGRFDYSWSGLARYWRKQLNK